VSEGGTGLNAWNVGLPMGRLGPRLANVMLGQRHTASLVCRTAVGAADLARQAPVTQPRLCINAAAPQGERPSPPPTRRSQFLRKE
jgi:hypothetical protein